MKFNHHLPENLHNLIYFAALEEPEDDESNMDNFGVGAMMPQDMSDFTILAEPESYGV
jgi:hypothetical protein